MKTDNYSKIRFIGYAIPTGPLRDQIILSQYLVGSYLGSDDFEQDIAARVAILKNAVDVAKHALPDGEDVNTVNNIFMAPEFFFHGPQGPYIYDSKMPDPVEKIQALLAATFGSIEYPNWTFIFGTAVTARVENINAVFQSHEVKMHKNLIKNLAENAMSQFGNSCNVTTQILHDAMADIRASPAVEVRDRALIFSNLLIDSPLQPLAQQQITTEKYFLSNMDFLLFETRGKMVITEEMVAYPHIDLSNGDIKQAANDPYAIFRQNYGVNNLPSHLDFAVEICLDHDDARLRKNMTKEPFPKDTDAIHIQLVPSCGSVIVPQAVVANKNGFIFNCDGNYAFDLSNEPNQGIQNGVACAYASYTASVGSSQYAAHTQLARVSITAKGNNPNLKSAQFQVLDTDDIVSIPITLPASLKDQFTDYFAGGAGGVHIYGLASPYQLLL